MTDTDLPYNIGVLGQVLLFIGCWAAGMVLAWAGMWYWGFAPHIFWHVAVGLSLGVVLRLVLVLVGAI